MAAHTKTLLSRLEVYVTLAGRYRSELIEAELHATYGGETVDPATHLQWTREAMRNIRENVENATTVIQVLRARKVKVPAALAKRATFLAASVTPSGISI